MKKTTASLLAGLLSSLFSFGQNALFMGTTVLYGETRIDYSDPTAQPGLLDRNTIQLTVKPRLGFSFLKFSEKEHFHQAGLYGLHSIRFENTTLSQQQPGGPAMITDGTKIVAAGGGLHYRYGWKAGRAGENWLFHVSANAGAFFQNIQQTPKTSAAFPVRARVAGAESGFRLHVLRKFGGTGFLSLGIPLLFVEMEHTTVNIENPSLPASQQKQSNSTLSFNALDRLGVEFGGGFYLQQKKK